MRQTAALCIFSPLFLHNTIINTIILTSGFFWVFFFFFKSPTADAISKVSGEQQSQSFNNAFMPHGRPLSAGSYVRLPRLAGVLEAGLLNFYHGNLSQEIVDEVTDIHIQTGMTL